MIGLDLHQTEKNYVLKLIFMWELGNWKVGKIGNENLFRTEKREWLIFAKM
jgi:hypothetical protein